ncbi:MAG: CCA-adding enzyme [Smithella sp. PtaU1.Bin162]|nr:MAG: CCA-adding enzyme [Smithella sp. PtaU1.Bin162]
MQKNENKESGDLIRAPAMEIVRKLKSEGFEAYFVGGCVRDFIRNVLPDDYDIVTSAHPEQVMAIFPRTVAVGAKFGVVAVLVENHSYEVATFRSDDAYVDGRRPSGVRFSDAHEDVFRRDFTVNGILQNPDTNEIIDYVHGLDDIEQKIIRTIGDPDKRFNEDFLRMLRAVRFAANLDYEIDPATKEAIAKNAANIRQISAERLQDELNKILARKGSRRGFELMSETGLLREVLPEVDRLKGVSQPPLFHPEGDVWQHTLMMLELLPEDDAIGKRQLAWAALLHDAGKAVTRTEDERGVHFYGHVRAGEEIAGEIMQRLRFSRADEDLITDLIHYHMVFMNVQKMRRSRLKRFLRMSSFNLHLELHRLDCLASHNMLDNYEFCRVQLQNMAEEDLHPPRLLTGDDLMALGFTPGKIMGEILHTLEDRQLEGIIATRQEAEEFVLRNWNK